MLMFKISYYIVVTVADFIDVLTNSIVSLSHGIGEVSGMARKKSLFRRICL